MIRAYTPQFIEKLYVDAQGRQFRLVFQVSQVGFDLKARLISVEPVTTNSGLLKGEVTHISSSAFLPIDISKKAAITEYIFPDAPVVSPYISLKFLITSQPTRAPSFV